MWGTGAAGVGPRPTSVNISRPPPRPGVSRDSICWSERTPDRWLGHRRRPSDVVLDDLPGMRPPGKTGHSGRRLGEGQPFGVMRGLMMAVTSYLRSLERSRHARTRMDRPAVFTMCGREWDLLPDVFAPIYSPSTGAALEFLGLGSGSPCPAPAPF